MRTTTTIAGVLTASLCATHAVVAAEPQRIEPTSQWVLDYADEHCSLARTFGSDDTAATLRISSYGSWNVFETFLAGPLIPRGIGPYGSVRIAFPPDTEKRDLVFVLKGTANAQPAVSFDTYFGPYDARNKGKRLIGDDRMRAILDRDRPYPQFDAQIDRITLNFDNAAPMTLHVENMAPPLAALRACVDDLYKSWGLDPSVQKALSRRAQPLPLTVAELERHYPANELGKGTNARVRVRIKIDPSGQPTSCVVETKSTDELFRKTVCDHLKGGFEPALDNGGRAVESVFFTAVNFMGS